VKEKPKVEHQRPKLPPQRPRTGGDTPIMKPETRTTQHDRRVRVDDALTRNTRYRLTSVMPGCLDQ
jgi:hypothetical protein